MKKLVLAVLTLILCGLLLFYKPLPPLPKKPPPVVMILREDGTPCQSTTSKDVTVFSCGNAAPTPTYYVAPDGHGVKCTSSSPCLEATAYKLLGNHSGTIQYAAGYYR